MFDSQLAIVSLDFIVDHSKVFLIGLATNSTLLIHHLYVWTQKATQWELLWDKDVTQPNEQDLRHTLYVSNHCIPQCTL